MQNTHTSAEAYCKMSSAGKRAGSGQYARKCAPSEQLQVQGNACTSPCAEQSRTHQLKSAHPEVFMPQKNRCNEGLRRGHGGSPATAASMSALPGCRSKPCSKGIVSYIFSALKTMRGTALTGLPGAQHAQSCTKDASQRLHCHSVLCMHTTECSSQRVMLVLRYSKKTMRIEARSHIDTDSTYSC